MVIHLHTLFINLTSFESVSAVTDIVLVLIGLETANSLIVEWLIPSVLVPQLVECARQLNFGFYHDEHILMMTVDEKQILPMFPDSKPKVLRTAAATVKVIILGNYIMQVHSGKNLCIRLSRQLWEVLCVLKYATLDIMEISALPQ